MPNSKTVSKTNKTLGSQQIIPLKKLSFDELWSAYPSDQIEHLDPKMQKDVFSDHCAINMSEALYKSGVLLKTFKGTKCWNCPTPDPITKKGIHAVRAQELSDYLKQRPFAGCPIPVSLTGSNYEETVQGKKGIIFFQDYWLRDGEKIPTGDHIDLWNENSLASIGWFNTWIRRAFPSASETLFSMSDLRNSKQVLFWELL